MNWLVFEDDATTQLYPITIGRAAYAISCGGYRLFDFLERLEGPVSAIVRPHLENIQQRDFGLLSPFSPNVSGPLACLNARCAPSHSDFAAFERLVAQGAPFVARRDETIVAALLPSLPVDNGDVDDVWSPSKIQDHLRTATADLPEANWDPLMFDYPHDVVRHHMDILDANLQDRLRREGYTEIRDGVFAAEDVRLADHIVSDTSSGPILLDRGASIGPYCLLSGPAYVGQNTRVIEHAALKDGVSLGHTTKIGGEVEASVIEPYTNKQHYGFLGHSYLGSWINLGAGTCNSDLKNTYGVVNMEYSGVKVKTGMQFLGCILGDYAKSAINTGIFTGKTIGACSMLYGFITENVPSFVNYARLFGQVAELPPEVMIATQQRMFSRRKVEQRECDIQLIRDMFELTRFEREWSAADVLSL